MDKIVKIVKSCVPCSYCKSKSLDITANFKIGVFNIFCNKCGKGGPGAGSPELARDAWNNSNRINKKEEIHICIDCNFFIPDRKIRIGKCVLVNRIVHKDEKVCKTEKKGWNYKEGW